MAGPDRPAGAHWKKSSWSAGNGSCVEVADLPDRTIGVRNSRDNSPGCPVLTFARSDWDAFITDVRKGYFDLP